ncbi:MAG: SDR family oxidoreductase [Planctomycetota bacterium]|nr:SDR family oxidoreductase [Planctomycetota bacterium]
MDRLVIGCGYLGLQVAKRWLRAGDNVLAMTRSPERAERLKALGIEPMIADVSVASTLEQLPDAKTVLYAVGFEPWQKGNAAETYLAGFRNVLTKLPPQTGQLIYISTTGVYGGYQGDWITESTPVAPSRPSSQACLLAETELQQSPWWERSVILRLAGIYGAGRIPNRSKIENREWSELSPQGYVNLIHVDDAALIVQQVANMRMGQETFLVADGNPPCRTDFYEYIAERLGVGPICWDNLVETESLQGRSANKRISNSRLLERTGVVLGFPDFRKGIDQALI